MQVKPLFIICLSTFLFIIPEARAQNIGFGIQPSFGISTYDINAEKEYNTEFAFTVFIAYQPKDKFIHNLGYGFHHQEAKFPNGSQSTEYKIAKNAIRYFPTRNYSIGKRFYLGFQIPTALTFGNNSIVNTAWGNVVQEYRNEYTDISAGLSASAGIKVKHWRFGVILPFIELTYSMGHETQGVEFPAYRRFDAATNRIASFALEVRYFLK